MRTPSPCHRMAPVSFEGDRKGNRAGQLSTKCSVGKVMPTLIRHMWQEYIHDEAP